MSNYVITTYNVNREKFAHRATWANNTPHVHDRETEISGFMGKNQPLPAGTDYNMRVELIQNLIKSDGSRENVIVGCARIKNITIAGEEMLHIFN